MFGTIKQYYCSNLCSIAYVTVFDKSHTMLKLRLFWIVFRADGGVAVFSENLAQKKKLRLNTNAIRNPFLYVLLTICLWWTDFESLCSETNRTNVTKCFKFERLGSDWCLIWEKSETCLQEPFVQKILTSFLQSNNRRLVFYVYCIRKPKNI